MKKVYVEKKRCISCGACVSIADEIFEFDEEGKSQVIPNAEVEVEVESEKVNLAIESCPTSAISYVDEENVNVVEEEIESCECETCACDHCHCAEDEFEEDDEEEAA